MLWKTILPISAAIILALVGSSLAVSTRELNGEWVRKTSVWTDYTQSKIFWTSLNALAKFLGEQDGTNLHKIFEIDSWLGPDQIEFLRDEVARLYIPNGIDYNLKMKKFANDDAKKKAEAAYRDIVRGIIFDECRLYSKQFQPIFSRIDQDVMEEWEHVKFKYFNFFRNAFAYHWCEILLKDEQKIIDKIVELEESSM